jgi:hypothetical protein
MTDDEVNEQIRVQELTDPLFQMLLDFERAFTAKAIDELNVTDTDAELAAQLMEDSPGLGAAYVYLLRQISMERIIRSFCHKASAVMAATGRTMLRTDEVGVEYAKLDKGDA